jgi:hypothetical protein
MWSCLSSKDRFGGSESRLFSDVKLLRWNAMRRREFLAKSRTGHCPLYG